MKKVLHLLFIQHSILIRKYPVILKLAYIYTKYTAFQENNNIPMFTMLQFALKLVDPPPVS